MKHGLSRTWAHFGTCGNELTNKRDSLFDRMRLFNAVLTQSVLYGCGGWAMNQSRAMQLRITQRKMLRAIMGKGRKQETTQDEVDFSKDESVSVSMDNETIESGVFWIQRTTHEIVDIM